jgi:hypothetical protein
MQQETLFLGGNDLTFMGGDNPNVNKASMISYESLLTNVDIDSIEIYDFEAADKNADKNTDKKNFTLYLIRVSANHMEYEIGKRFREFYELNKSIRKKGILIFLTTKKA